MATYTVVMALEQHRAMITLKLWVEFTFVSIGRLELKRKRTNFCKPINHSKL